MAGAPVPSPTHEKILSIADLEEAGSRKLGMTARGEFGIVSALAVMIVYNITIWLPL